MHFKKNKLLLIGSLFCLLVFQGKAFVSDMKWEDDLWKTLFKVKYGNWRVQFAPEFPPEIKALDGKNVCIQGFLIPVEQKTKHSFFLLSAFPFDQCFYCGKAGPETVIEVTASRPLKHTEKPITITGKLRLNYDSPDHLFYLMSNAKLVE